MALSVGREHGGEFLNYISHLLVDRLFENLADNCTDVSAPIRSIGVNGICIQEHRIDSKINNVDHDNV